MPGICDQIVPPLYELGNGQRAACLLYDEQVMSGAKGQVERVKA
jgi:hypothetical protein